MLEQTFTPCMLGTTPSVSFKVGNHEGLFRTLSKDEWKHLLFDRNMTGARYEYVTSGVTFKDGNSQDVTFYGVILFPDGYTRQSTWKSDYTTWKQVVDAGLVCLPDEADTTARGAAYWTSTPELTPDAYYVSLVSSYGVSVTYYGRDQSYFVRLVAQVELN